jgi:hypothetical protein
MPSKRKRPADEPINSSIPATSAKRVKCNPTPPTKVDSATSPKDTNKPSKKSGYNKSKLIPRGDRKTATLGQRDDSLLRMLCDTSTTGRVKELQFRKIPHSQIQWTNPAHISKINAWRNQIYGRAGLKAKTVTMWHEMEELWFELYFQVSIIESRKRGLLLPKTAELVQAFSGLFAGRVLQDSDGEDIPARTARLLNAFASKYNRVCPLLKARLAQSVVGKFGDTFIPEITMRMLERYKGMKDGMAAKGIAGESAYAENLEEWKDFLLHLPDGSDAEMLDTDVSKADEENAAAALISLASSPIEVAVGSEGTTIAEFCLAAADFEIAAGADRPSALRKEMSIAAMLCNEEDTLIKKTSDDDKENKTPQLV